MFIKSSRNFFSFFLCRIKKSLDSYIHVAALIILRTIQFLKSWIIVSGVYEKLDVFHRLPFRQGSVLADRDNLKQIYFSNWQKMIKPLYFFKQKLALLHRQADGQTMNKTAVFKRASPITIFYCSASKQLLCLEQHTFSLLEHLGFNKEASIVG